MAYASEEQAEEAEAIKLMYTCVNKHVDFQAAFPPHKTGCAHLRVPEPQPYTRIRACSQSQSPNFALSVSQRANTQNMCLVLPFPENMGAGWNLAPPHSKAAGERLGCLLLSMGGVAPPDSAGTVAQLQPETVSDLLSFVVVFGKC